MIGGSTHAAPVVIKGLVTNNSVPAVQGTWVRIQYTQLGDTLVATDSLGQYELTIKPRFIRGSVTASFIDTCRRDSIGDTKPFDTASTLTIIINLNGCVTKNLTLKGFIQNVPNPYISPLYLLYSFNQFQTQDTLEVDSTGYYSKTIVRNKSESIDYRLIDCNSNIIKDSVFYSHQDTITTNFNYCSTPTNSYFGIIQLNGVPISGNLCQLLRYEYSIPEQAMLFKDTLRVNSNGRFSFLKDTTSDYLLKAIPTTNQQQFSATYYPSGFSWAKNSLVIGPHISDTTALIIELNKKETSQTGRAVINGELKIDEGLRIPGYDGMGIHLLNKDEVPIDYKYADASDNFIFENLAPGNYFIWLDQCGIPTEPIPVTISSNSESIDGLIITANQLGISYDSFVSIDQKTEPLQKNISAFPNPFSNQLELHSSQEAKIIVFNLFGQPITNFNLIENETRIIDTATWRAGFYVINIRSKTKEYSIKLLKD